MQYNIEALWEKFQFTWGSRVLARENLSKTAHTGSPSLSLHKPLKKQARASTDLALSLSLSRRCITRSVYTYCDAAALSRDYSLMQSIFHRSPRSRRENKRTRARIPLMHAIARHLGAALNHECTPSLSYNVDGEKRMRIDERRNAHRRWWLRSEKPFDGPIRKPSRIICGSSACGCRP